MKRTRSAFLVASAVITFSLGSHALAADPPIWPNLSVLEEIDTPGLTYAGGIPVKVRAIRVKEQPRELVPLFVETFTRARLYVPPGKDQPQLTKLPMLTAYDPRRKVSYSVIFQPNGDGTTTLLLGESHLAKEERLQSAASTPVPVFPGAKEPMTMRQEGADVLSYRVPGTTPEAEVFDFYASALKSDGYAPATGEEGGPGVFVKSGARVQVTTELRDSERSVVVLVRTR